MNLESIYHKVEQGSPEWFDLRLGRFTASTVKNLLMAHSTAGYQNEIKRAAFEIVTGLRAESFESEWMTRGKEMEQEAREIYQATTFNVVQESGFFTYGDHMGASPDGLIGDDGILEVKCPKYNTMIDYLISGTIPSIYESQIQAQLICTGREWCDFVAYHPGMRTLIVRVGIDVDLRKRILTAVDGAIDKLNEIIKQIS